MRYSEPIWTAVLRANYNEMVKQNATLDSSFWINAYRSGIFPHVLARFQIHYAPEVAAEMREGLPAGREFWRLAREGTLVEAVPRLNRARGFGPGERATINLALEHRDWVVLTDDRRPFLEAERQGLKVLCTPVLAVELYAANRLDSRQAVEMLARLAAMQTVSPDLISASLAHLASAMKE